MYVPNLSEGLSFRDLSKFNISLLVKQGWCTIVEPTYLLFKVIKAKYFPSNEFLNSTLSNKLHHVDNLFY